MAHPQKADAAAGHTAKLRRMTEDYGSAAGPSENIPAESNRLKQEGPEDEIGFGADASAPKARGDRASRRTTAANPVSTYRRGGKVKHHGKKRADGGDVSAIEEANKNQSIASRARGGRMKGKGTHVNVIVAPQGTGGPGAMPPPVIPVGAPPPAAAMPPPRPPMMPPGGPMAGPAGLPMAPGAPGGMPPGLMPPRAKGGRVKHADEKEDKALIMKTLRDEGLTRADHEVKRARGGKIKSIHDMTAGAASGEGRLEKIELQEHAGRKAPQTV